MRPKIIYVYDALCGWCYGFSPAMLALKDLYCDQFDFEVISGGMMTGLQTGPVSVVAPYIQTAYKTVEETTGINFGEGFLKQVEKGSMILDSEKPAIALSVYKSYHPENTLQFAYDIQQCINFDGKEPNDDDMYRYLAVNFGIDPDEFVHKMREEEFKQAAYYDFALTKQLRIDSFPAVLIQSADNYFFLIARGYASQETMELRIENVLKDMSKSG
ncbi:DsbA family protein [Desertivirga xinjiangensis]|uniref:DsbA family protein n=1 Tax=Desertivirga xinjiangensis TaxID=539206 RepID=UPI00210F1AFF|nr:DsbA family protein [Pedobacter xinjiangensis]